MNEQLQKPDEFSFVSGYYGPGVVLCWGLVTWAFMLTWPLDPHHAASQKDVISNDLIAILMYPAIAAGHVFVQVTQHGNFREAKNSGDATLIAHAASIHASAMVCSLYLGLSVVFLSRFLLMRCNADNHSPIKWRASFVAVVAFWCLIADLLGREVIITTVCGGIVDLVLGIILSFQLWILGLTTACGLGLSISLMLNLIYSVMAIITQYELLSLLRRHLYLLRPQPLEQNSRPVMIGYTFCMWLGILTFSAGTWWVFYGTTILSVPRTSMSVGDLDQATALIGGIITFIFSLARFCRNNKWALTDIGVIRHVGIEQSLV